MNGVTDIARSIITAKWKEVVIGVLTLLLATCLTVIGSALVTDVSKFNRIPDPDQIATVPMVNQRLKDEDQKIDTSAATNHESLVRIENKLDTLILSMATRRRVEREIAPSEEPTSNRSEQVLSSK